jgi:aminopeptidase N
MARDPEKLSVYNLTREEAFRRSSLLSEVSYSLQLRLLKDTHYEGTVLVKFSVRDPQAEIWLDFKAEEISSFQVNGTDSAVNWLRGKLHLSGLQAGENSVSVAFKNNYSNDGCGLHQFTDPEDGESYVYTQFEPFYAHRCFPCFDQPDLKAVLQLTVAAPDYWKVIANSFEVESTEDRLLPIGEGEKLHAFKPTARISTYLYAVCAGPYHEWRVEDSAAGVPLGFYCRKALVPYFVLERYTDPTIKGFLFYNEFFNLPYPFEKYDQVFVPEFNFGAMENVGCVTYQENYVFRDPPSRNNLLGLAIVMLHEMAHMWFGNLVTMVWWDDLWLNESFADYICFYAIDKGMPGAYNEVWQSFLDSKGWGYDTDQLSTTHPISCNVTSIDQVETNFDGISYSKGAASLKQLSFVVGEEQFRAGLRKYMHKHQFSNATFNDLITMLDQEVELDLQEWADSWIKTAGLNEIKPIITLAEGRIQHFEVLQTPALSAHSTLRSHKLVAEFYDAEFNLTSSQDLQIEPREHTVVSSAVGLPAPALVLLNGGDQAYVKLVIDPSTFSSLKEGLHKMKDPLSRQLIYRSAWDLVRDLKVSGAEFAELVSRSLPNETNLFNIVYLLMITKEALQDYVPSGEAADSFYHSVFTTITAKIRAAEDAGTIVQLQKFIFSYADHQEDVDLAVQWLVNSATDMPGFDLSQGDRWKILKLYAAWNSERATALYSAEALKDSSDTGKLNLLYCEAAVPTAENKAAWWERFRQSGQAMSRYERQYAMAGFNQKRQTELLLGYVDKFFEALPEFISTANAEFAYDFCEGLIPEFYNEAALLPRVSAAVAAIPEGYAKISRFLTEKADLLAKHHAGKELSASYLSNRA